MNRYIMTFVIMFLIMFLIFLLNSCDYKQDGQIVKTADGKFYKLERAVARESYFLKEIDTVAINKLIK